MTSKCAVTINWAGGAHSFDLSHPWVRNVLSIRGLPGAIGSTPTACLKRFEDAIYSPDDVERVIELGLIGGGATRREAETLIADHVRGKPLAPNATVAFQVLASLFVGVNEDVRAST